MICAICVAFSVIAVHAYLREHGVQGDGPSLLLSSLHPVSRTGYGGQVELLVSDLQSKSWHIQLLAWNLKHRGEAPAADLEALLRRKGISETETLKHASGDPRALLPGVPVVTSQIAPPTGHEEGLGWIEILRAVDLFSKAASACDDSHCPFRAPDLVLHLHDAWWLGPPPAQVRDAVKTQHLPPMVSWLPILFDPLLSDDPERPDRSGAALEVFSGVISMSLWGRGVYERALADLAAVLGGARHATVRWLPPLLGHIPHALHPAFGEGPLAFESVTRRELRQLFRLPEMAFVVLLVGRNPPPPSSEANRKSHRTAVRAFARFRKQVSELCEQAGTPSKCPGGAVTHLHVHSDLHGSVDIQSLLKDAGLSLEDNGGASSSREHLSPELLRHLYTASDVLLQLSRAEGFGLPIIEAQACGTPVIVNGATAMAENVILGKILVTPRQSPTGGRSDRPGSWTPPDGAAAVEALLEIWSSPPTAIERNRARIAFQSFFAPSHVGEQMVQILYPLLKPRHGNLQASLRREASNTDANASVSQKPQDDSSVQKQTGFGPAFCYKEFQQLEICHVHGKRCQESENSLRECFARDWDKPTLAPGFEGRGVHRLIPTRFAGQMLYNVYDLMVGRTLELCGEWLTLESAIYAKLQPEPDAAVRIVEAGANIGALTIQLAMQIPQGRVLALEPFRVNLQLLNANIALAQLSNVDTFQAVLGDTPGSLQVTEPADMSFYDSWRLVPGKPGPDSTGRVKSVQVATIDQLLGHVDRVDFIRLNLACAKTIPGAIRGAEKSLQRFRPWLLIELAMGQRSFSKLNAGEGADDKEQEIRSALQKNQYECNWSSCIFLGGFSGLFQ